MPRQQRPTYDQLDQVIGMLYKIDRKLDAVIVGLRISIAMEEEQMASIEDVEAEVAEQTDVIASAVTLMNGLSQQLKDAIAANDPAALDAVVAQLDANTEALASAVAANTPASPEPTPEG